MLYGKRRPTYYERIILSGLTWGCIAPVYAGSVRTDSIEYATKCPARQMYVTCFDRVPLQDLEMQLKFRHIHMDVFGPIICYCLYAILCF